MQWSFFLYVSIVIEIKILLIDQIWDHFMCHHVGKIKGSPPPFLFGYSKAQNVNMLYVFWGVKCCLADIGMCCFPRQGRLEVTSHNVCFFSYDGDSRLF
jgi:hypothetical protein